MAKKVETPVHKDFWGEEVLPGDVVLAPNGEGRAMELYRILRMTPKLIRAKPVIKPDRYFKDKQGELLEPGHVVKVDPSLATALLMKNGLDNKW